MAELLERLEAKSVALTHLEVEETRLKQLRKVNIWGLLSPLLTLLLWAERGDVGETMPAISAQGCWLCIPALALISLVGGLFETPQGL